MAWNEQWLLWLEYKLVDLLLTGQPPGKLPSRLRLRSTVGATLTDALRNADSYRSRDVFHLSYACLLGCSPVTRALLGCKSRSDPAIDENEDGGRAIDFEEGLAASIFVCAATRDYLSRATHVDGDVLASIATPTAQFEVGARTAADWERAVLEGVRMWKQLDDHGGNLRWRTPERVPVGLLRITKTNKFATVYPNTPVSLGGTTRTPGTRHRCWLRLRSGPRLRICRVVR
ncbi:hypothetical protein [Amycolatopsis sp. WGS_07]|uniref:hypothetical protein n=1 Tax=Amycolatopsis sp. WGS_07 TaxID=3076764 RepID=UPI0038735986